MAGKKIDINTASVGELENLAGVGHHRAEAIIKHRRESGGFSSVVDLTQVPGISPTIIEQNRDKIVCRCRTSSAKKKHGLAHGTSRRATRQHCVPQDLGNLSVAEVIPQDCPLDQASPGPRDPTLHIASPRDLPLTQASPREGPLSHASPTTLHFTRSQSAALRLGQGCSTDTPPADNANATFIVTRSGVASCSKTLTTPLTSRRNEEAAEDSGNDGDDEEGGDQRVAAAANQEQDIAPPDAPVVDLIARPLPQLAGAGEDRVIRPDFDDSLNDDAHSVFSHYGESIGDEDCDNVEDEETEEADTEGEGGAHSDLGGSTRTTRSRGCSHREDNSDLSPLSRQSQLKRKSSFSRDDCDHPDSAMSPGKKLRLAMVSCHSCGQSLAGVPRWRLAQMPRGKIPTKDNPPHKMDDWLKQFQAWSNAERMMACDELINLCDPTLVRHMMAVIEPQFQRDFISLLPKELALYVLSFLGPRDLLRAAQTCRYWRILAEDNLLWREKCREEGVDEDLVYGPRARRRHLSRSPFKSLFMRQSQIEHNWRKGVKRMPKILKGHDDHVITCLEFCGNRVVSGSDDNTLKVWSVTSGKCLRTLIGHTGGVWSSQMSGTVVISGSTDRTLKVWNAETGQCRHTLYGHSSTVRCMSLHQNQVVSGSRDATLRVWDVDTGTCRHILMGHVAAVRCVQFDGKRVVSGAYDYTVRVWDPETEACLHTLQGHSNRVYSLQFDGVHVVSGSLDTSIRVWDVESGNCLHTLIGHQSLTSGLELKDNILVSGNADSTVKVWDITTGQCLQTLQGPNKHQSAVTCLQFSKKFVITSSDDGTVKIWDLKTGEFLRNLVSLASGGSGGVVWRLRCSNTRLVCAVGSRNGTEETKLMVLDFDVEERSRGQEVSRPEVTQGERRSSLVT